jgi:Fe-S-cluster containining protein
MIREQPRHVECTECGRCCTYVGVEIDKPKKASEASDILWYLYHENVYIYVDGDDEWSVHFEGRCRNLGDDLLCRVYEHRPDICRSFDSDTCEVNDHEGESLTFRHPVEFLDWLQSNKPRVYRKLEKKYLPRELRRADAAGGERGGKSDRKRRKDKARKR